MSFNIPLVPPGSAHSLYSNGVLDRALAGKDLPSSYSKNGDEAVIVSLSKDLSLAKVEKHLDDYSKGKGYLSSRTAKGLSTLNRANSSMLSQADPAAFSNYLAFSTGMDYMQKSRFVHSVNELASNLRAINSPSEMDISDILTAIEPKV
ncbi:hypothetical protein OAO01_00350 [Oligoflexia bacterium]|nr:hypothetical protein [Oligoflexia bacterium]